MKDLYDRLTGQLFSNSKPYPQIALTLADTTHLFLVLYEHVDPLVSSRSHKITI